MVLVLFFWFSYYSVSVSVNLKELRRVKSNLSDWVDYPSVVIIDAKTNEIRRFNPRQYEKYKKLTDPKVEEIDVFSLLDTPSIEIFYRENGLVMLHFSRIDKVLKAVKIRRQNHKLCVNLNYPDDTPSNILALFCCDKCIKYYGPIKSNFTDGEIIEIGLKNELKVGMLMDVVMNIRNEENVLLPNDDKLPLILEFLNEKSEYSDLFLRRDPTFLNDKKVNKIIDSDDNKKHLDDCLNDEEFRSYLIEKAEKAVKWDLIEHYCKERDQAGKITFDEDDEVSEGEEDELECDDGDLCQSFFAIFDGNITSDIFGTLEITDDNEELDSSHQIIKKSARRSLEFDGVKILTPREKLKKYIDSKSQYFACDLSLAMKPHRNAAISKSKILRKELEALDLECDLLLSQHDVYDRKLRLFKNCDNASRYDRNHQIVIRRQLKIITMQEKIRISLHNKKAEEQRKIRMMIHDDCELIKNSIFNVSAVSDELVESLTRTSDDVIHNIRVNLGCESDFAELATTETEVCSKLGKFFEGQVKDFQHTTIKNLEKIKSAANLFQKFMTECQDVVEGLKLDDFDGCKSKIDEFIFKYAPDVSSMELYGAVASTWDDFSREYGKKETQPPIVNPRVDTLRLKKIPPKPAMPESYSRGRSGSVAE